ncbi:MAG: nucleotide exchange factor GrpE [Verrucomicrobiales bacterium]|nr:nucleotide exchange factor GrpE [Verrucomicrobiales bacterium]
MLDRTPPPVPKWPFFLGDAVLLATAAFVYSQSRLPMGHWELAACVACIALGAGVSLLPFLLDYRAAIKALEADALGTVADKIQHLDRVAAQITQATRDWENVQLQAEKIAGEARAITDRITAEARDFTQCMERFNDAEKATLRLEAEKLRRAEADWLQVLVHVLDHVHALLAAATRANQPRVVEQLTRFQAACHDAARRVGVVPFLPAPGEQFDPQRHRSAEPDAPPPDGAVVSEVLAAGFTWQGRLVRPALVRLSIALAAQTTTALVPNGDRPEAA